MKYQDILDFFGSQAEMARQLGVTQVSASLWKIEGIPPMRAIEIERLSKGYFKAWMIVGLKMDGTDDE